MNDLRNWVRPLAIALACLVTPALFAAPATSAESLSHLPGFKVELLHSAGTNEGSWISLAIDNKGRLIVSPQDGKDSLLRITLDKAGQIAGIEKINQPVHGAMGLLYAFDSLYVNGGGPNGNGLYRLRDTDGKDQYNDLKFLKSFDGGGEHGPHGLALGPDQQIYIMNGNHTKLPEGLESDSPLRNWQEDLLLPRQWDANGHAAGILAPGGYVVRTDAEGKKWDVVLGGFRNAYDLAFNTDGELFTFDSDMEWDWGTPWYRPTRVNHCVIGGEYGWRSGSGVWPAHYIDSLPAVADIGIGCPTGVKFGTGAKFPGKYQKALFIMDWSYGRIIAMHLSPKGATYDSTTEVFIQGKPLNVTDLEVGQDGALYFITGGRGTQTGLYRVTYDGPAVKEPAKSAQVVAAEKAGAQAREIRHKLETYIGKKKPEAVAYAWPYLKSNDRFLRFAARAAIESQDLALWKDKALDEQNLDAFVAANLALVRTADASVMEPMLGGLDRFKDDTFNERQYLEAARLLEVAFARLGKIEGDASEPLNNALLALFPSKSEAINREVIQLLIALEAPGVVALALDHIDKLATQEDQLHYIFHLRTLKTGWTLEQRKRYFAWFNRDFNGTKHPDFMIQWFKDVGLDFHNGHSFKGFVANTRKDAVATLSDADRGALAALITGQAAPVKKIEGRTFVKDWKGVDVMPDIDQAAHGRNFEKGRQAFEIAQCSACHFFKTDGGGVGPDLTAISARFTRKDILESILEPSKVLSEQYQNQTVVKKDGDEVTGRLVDDNAQALVLVPNPLALDRVTIPKSEIKQRIASKISPMPEGLLNLLSKEEILDLLAYLESAGNPAAPAFKQ